MEESLSPRPLTQLKRDLIAASAEFLGTVMFLLLGLGGIQASAASRASSPSVGKVADLQQIFYISFSMSFSLLAAAWTFYRVSGSVFNPNIALALFIIGGLKPMRFALYVTAQMTGATVASAILNVILPGPLVGAVSLGPRIKPWQGVFIEALLTCALTLTILFLAVEKHRTTPVAPVAIGLVLFAAHLFGVVYTGAGLNSARAFGVAMITGFDRNHWVYWVGPTLGSLLATTFYFFFKIFDYHESNCRQDSVDVRESPAGFMGLRFNLPDPRHSYVADMGTTSAH